MKMIFTSQDEMMVCHLKYLLEGDEVMFITNKNLADFADSMDINYWQELWISDDSPFKQAKEIEDKALSIQNATICNNSAIFTKSLSYNYFSFV